MLKSCIPWVSAALLLWMPVLAAQTVHISHCLAGCPAGAPEANELVVRHLFAASINFQSGLADWVAYRVLPAAVGVASLLPREWQADALLEQDLPVELGATNQFVQPDISNLQDRDYRVNEIIINPQDRGRLVPMSSFAGTPYWEDLNYLSNMAPIPADLRLGPWSRLDQAINEMAARIGDVYVVSGPLYREAAREGGAVGASRRPLAFFKFVATTEHYAAFVFPFSAAQHSGYCERAIEIEQLQELSGFEFLPLNNGAGSTGLYGMLGCNSNLVSE